MLDYNGTLYKLVLLAHIVAVVVAVGSSFVWAAMSARARDLELRDAHLLNGIALKLSKGMTSMPFYGAAATGILLVAISAADDFGPWAFDQTWISAAFLLVIAGILVARFLHEPNLRALDELKAKLVAGGGTRDAGGPPAEVAELEERGKQAAMYGGILHLITFLLLVDMVFKPVL